MPACAAEPEAVAVEVAAAVALCSEDGSLLLTSVPRDPQPRSALAACSQHGQPQSVSEVLGANLTAGARLSISSPARLEDPALGRRSSPGGEGRCPQPSPPCCFCPLFGCWRQSHTGACAVPSRGTVGVSHCLSRPFQGGVSFSGDSAASRCCCHRLLCSPRSRALGRGKDTLPPGSARGHGAGRVVRGSSPPSCTRVGSATAVVRFAR